jgi:hypothetical protein
MNFMFGTVEFSRGYSSSPVTQQVGVTVAIFEGSLVAVVRRWEWQWQFLRSVQWQWQGWFGGKVGDKVGGKVSGEVGGKVCWLR